jgi:hypothetical protein
MMKHLRRICASFVLLLALSMSVFAGDISTPGVAGETQTPPGIAGELLTPGLYSLLSIFF